MCIMGTRLALGNNDDLINHELACKLYEIATTVQTPIFGGHPVAMLHLALHYERGIGVQQSHTDAYRYITNQLLIILFLVKKILVLYL